MEGETPKIDSLEFARGVLSVASFVSSDKSREVHITKLMRHFERAGISSTEALKALWFLREAENLGEGYWIPAPTRTVPLADGLCMIVGVQQTDELRRHFPGVQRAGQGRVVGTTGLSTLPVQSLNSWRDGDGLTATEWASSTIDGALSNFAPSVDQDGLEIFGVRPRSGTANHWEGFWTSLDFGDACMWKGVSLFRTRSGQSKHRYFLGQRKGKAHFLEGSAIHDVARMQYGLAALQGHPLRPTMTVKNSSTTISLSLAAPTSIRRLLVALCEEDRRSFGRTWRCNVNACEPILYNALKELSGEVLRHG